MKAGEHVLRGAPGCPARELHGTRIPRPAAGGDDSAFLVQLAIHTLVLSETKRRWKRKRGGGAEEKGEQ